MIIVLGGGGVTCGRWEWRLRVAVFSVARGWVVGGGMQDELLPWLHLRCHALLTRHPPLLLCLQPPPRVSAAPSFPRFLSWLVPLYQKTAQSGRFAPSSAETWPKEISRGNKHGK
mmetsp:Transcript_20438/g.34473  ORF Transcript_20438/g.34473 Transcript_20438/m.34473 type:complete len:115 (-) Transcript_20438:675-1019(-)